MPQRHLNMMLVIVCNYLGLYITFFVGMVQLLLVESLCVTKPLEWPMPSGIHRVVQVAGPGWLPVLKAYYSPQCKPTVARCLM